MAIEDNTIRENAPTRRQILNRALGAVAIIGAGAVMIEPVSPLRRTRRIPVRFWHMWTAEWQTVIKRIVNRFNESQSRYEVQPLSVPAGSADSKFLLTAVGGDPPDLMAQWNPVLPTWAENGILYPLDTLMSDADRRLFASEAYPFVQKVGMFRGKLYALGIGPNLNVCFYRADHFRQAGIDPDRFPTTLEELTTLAEKLHRYDKSSNLTRIGFLPTQFNLFAGLFGGGFYDDIEGKVTIQTEANLRALTCIADAHRKLGYNNIVRFTSGLTSDSGSVDWPFITGAYSISVDGQWRVEQLAKFGQNVDYRTAPLPPPQGGTPNAGSSNADMLIIPRDAREPQGAWEFMKFWSGLDNPEGAADFYIWGGWLPIRRAIAESRTYRAYLEKYPALKTFLAVLPSAHLQPPPPVPYQAYLADSINRTQDLVIRGTLTPKQALEQLDADIQREQKRRRKLGYGD